MLFMKRFAKKIKQKMNIGTPFEILSIIYTDSIQREMRVKKEAIFITFSAVSSEKMRPNAHFNILPPSSEARGRRLNIDKQSDNMEKGNKKL